MTPDTLSKRHDLMRAIAHLLEPHDCVQGVVAVGSVATNTARSDSDIDAIVFMSPLDRYIVPAEALWRPKDDSFHSIFATDVGEDAIPLDLMLRDFDLWRDSEAPWTDAQKAGLVEAWIAFDRHGDVATMIQEKTTYTETMDAWNRRRRPPWGS